MDWLINQEHRARAPNVPAFLALFVAAALVTALLYWSADRTDKISIARQEQLVSHVIDQSVTKMIQEQESVTFKDNWVTFLKAPVVTPSDVAIVNGNLGPFLNRYFGHDESYLLNANDRAFYAMRNGRRVAPRTFEIIRDMARPLIAELRSATKAWGGRALPNGSPGAFDMVVVNGRPAVLSLKPVISPTGRVSNGPPGKEVLQISVLYLDGPFLERLSKNYLLNGVRFSSVDDRGHDESAQPFVSRRTGKVIGYFIWRPYHPGTVVLRDMLVPLALTLLLIAIMVHLLLRRLQRSTAQLQASEAQAKHLAFHDILTGLPNRALFDDRLERALATVRRYPDQQMALLYLDLDRFKQVNDTLGHPAGDELIRELGKRLDRVVRDTDTVARLGGDEFGIIQTDVQSQHDIQMLCERILETVNAPFDVIGSQVFVGMSIGIACSGVDGVDRTELTRKADIALYQAKTAGRGQYAIFADSMDATIQHRRAVEQSLRAALDRNDQLKVYYQPQFDATSGLTSGVEALVRWQHPEYGLVCPTAFIPIAEESGLIIPLGEWVLREACLAALQWPATTVSVNVSPVQLRNPIFGEQVIKILEMTQLEPGRLEVEITETAFLENVDQCEANLQTLRELGVRIALDDFGTGYSSFSHLRQYKVDRLKIDRSFTAAIDTSLEGSAIIRAIVALAHSTGLKITAEGVETAEQSQFLCSIGCDELQGFLLSKPVTLHEIDRMLGVDPQLRHAHVQSLAA